MPSDLFSISQNDIKMRFGDIYATEGMNAKLAGIMPAGIYRGFRLATHGNNLTINIARNAASNDSLAVYETITGYSLTINQGADIPLDLTTYASKTVVITVHADFTLAPTTAATIRVYELSPVDEFTGAAERPELVVLGTVVVPAAGVIPGANITHDRRTPAYQRTAPEAQQWAPVVRNPSFEMAEAAGLLFAARYWELEGAGSQAGIRNTSPIRTGSNVARFTGANLNVKVFQWVNIPVLAGRLIKVRGWVSTQAAKSGGSLSFFLDFGDTTGVFVSETLIDVATGADGGAFRLIEATISAPSGVSFLRRVGMRADALLSVTNATLDDFQVFVERLGPESEDPMMERSRAPVSANNIIMEDPTALFSALGALFRFELATPSGEGQVALRRKDLTGGPGILPPAWFVAGRQFLGDLLISSEEDFLRARNNIKYSTSVSEQTLMEENEPSPLGAGVRLRQYRGSDMSFSYTINAKWRAAGVDNWTADDTTQPAYLFRFKPNQLVFGKVAAPIGAPWTDGTFANSNPPFDMNVGGGVSALRTRLKLGEDHIDAGTASNPRLLFPQSALTARTLNYADTEFDGITGPHTRHYMNTSGELEWTVNARWNGSGAGEWQPDVAGQNATLIRVKRNGFFVYGKAAPGGNWNDNTWVLGMEFDPITRIQKIYDGSIAFGVGSTAYPASNVGWSNEIRAAMVPKAYGRVTIVDNGGSPSITAVVKGCNIGLLVGPSAGAGSVIQVDFATPMADNLYSVFFTNYSDTGVGALQRVWSVDKTTMTPNHFLIRAASTDAGGANDLTVGDYEFSFLVMGQQ